MIKSVCDHTATLAFGTSILFSMVEMYSMAFLMFSLGALIMVPVFMGETK